MLHVPVSSFFQCGDQLFQFPRTFPMDIKLLHKNTSCVLFHKEVRKKPIVRRAFGMRFFPIGQPLAPYKSRLPCGHRGCPSRTLYGVSSITWLCKKCNRFIKRKGSFPQQKQREHLFYAHIDKFFIRNLILKKWQAIFIFNKADVRGYDGSMKGRLRLRRMSKKC